MKTVTVILRDYNGEPTKVEIPADCDHIAGEIISGDLIMYEPFYKDSSDYRPYSFYDGAFYVSKCNFERMNEMTSSYDIQELD